MLRTVATALVAALGMSLNAYAAPIQINFGFARSSLPALNWNSIEEGNSQHPITNIPDLIDANGNNTGYGIELLGQMNGNSDGANDGTNGTRSPEVAALFPVDVTSNTLFGAGNNSNFSSLGEIALTNLDPSLTYDFTIFASRANPDNTSDERWTKYQFEGATTETTYLDPYGNTSEMAYITGLAPDANGEILLSFSASTDPGFVNTNSSQFFYLGGIIMEPIPEPTSGVLLALASGGLMLGRRRRRA